MQPRYIVGSYRVPGHGRVLIARDTVGDQSIIHAVSARASPDAILAFAAYVASMERQSPIPGRLRDRLSELDVAQLGPTIVRHMRRWSVK